MDIIYLGGGFRENTLERLITTEMVKIKLLVLSRYERYLEKFLQVARKYHLDVVLVSKKDFAAELKKYSADILLSVGCRYIIPGDVLSQYRYCINVHPAILPGYRGGYCGSYVLLNGEKETGITVHFMDEGIDTGDILYQKRYPIFIFDTVRSVTAKNRELEPEVTCHALELLKSGKYHRMKQENVIPVYPKRSPSDSEIDPTKPLLDQLNIIRASHPEKFPAFFYLEGEKVVIRLQRESIPDKDKERGMI